MGALSRAVLIEAVSEIGQRWLPYAIAVTPVGGIMSHPTKAHAAGEMKRQWRYFRNRSGFETIKNFSPHATIIDRGRKRGVTPIGQARKKSHRKQAVHHDAKMLGSKQAPTGITKPVWRYINTTARPDISAKAIAKAEASFPASPQ